MAWNDEIPLCEIAGLSFFLFPAEERFNILKGKIEFPVGYYPFLVFMIAYFSYYVYNSYKSLQNYKISHLQIYSYRENVDLLWLRRLVVLFSLDYNYCVSDWPDILFLFSFNSFC